jgi:K(+)-stimulated pyrophosphate-energized sodium pump
MFTGFSVFESTAILAVLGIAFLGLAYAVFLRKQILREEKGTGRMEEVWGAIKSGATAYLGKQWQIIRWMIGILVFGLFLSAWIVKPSPEAISQFGNNARIAVALGRAGAFLMGAFFSLMVGRLGMMTAIQGSIRVATAAKKVNFPQALKIAYRTGTITGMLTDGLGLFGGTLIFIIFGKSAPDALLGFGFGGTLLALFMRVGGGIYTKAADVGADIVGKVEKNIPEDDPRNPAVIADLVGDNVGDCAGMAADIFESYEVTIVSALILGVALWHITGEVKWIVFPLLVRGIGVFSSIIGTYFVRGGKNKNPMTSINVGFYTSALISVIGFGLLAVYYMHEWRAFASTLAGVLLVIAIGRLTEYFTDHKYAPVSSIVNASKTGAATNILSGLSVGLESSVWSVLVIAATILVALAIYWGQPITFVLYGVAMTGIGMLTLTGNNVAMDSYGPIVDNAGGIGEMAKFPDESQAILDRMDATGNTTKAITKGVAIGSAVIAAVSLFGAFITDVNAIDPTALKFGIRISEPIAFVGLLIGGAIPLLFSSLLIKAVSRAASSIIDEVRRQFKNPGLMAGKVKPDYTRPVSLCTSTAQKELLPIGIIAICVPLVVGLALRAEALGAFLAGIILVGQLFAVFMSNAGGAWDNAKKYIETGKLGGKGSDAHMAAVVGDTVGDPLKDTAGPAMNPMIKVINLISVILAPIIVRYKFSPTIAVIVMVLLVAIIWAIRRSKDSSYSGVRNPVPSGSGLVPG